MVKTLLTAYEGARIDSVLPPGHFLLPLAGPNGMRTFLQSAFDGNDSDIAMALLKAGASPHVDGKRGRTLLMWAAEAGLSDMVKILLGKDVDINARDEAGWDALTFAWKSNHASVVSLLVGAGADIMSSDIRGQTVGMWASAQGHVEILGMIISSNPTTLTQMDSDRWTCLHHAASNDQLGAATELIRISGPYLREMFLADKNGRTPVDLSSGTDMVDLLEDALDSASQGLQQNSEVVLLDVATFLRVEIARISDAAATKLSSSGNTHGAFLITTKLCATIDDILASLESPGTQKPVKARVRGNEPCLVPNLSNETLADIPGSFPRTNDEVMAKSGNQEHQAHCLDESMLGSEELGLKSIILPTLVVTPATPIVTVENDQLNSNVDDSFPEDFAAPMVRLFEGALYNKVGPRDSKNLSREVWSSESGEEESLSEHDGSDDLQSELDGGIESSELEMEDYELI
ncbi:hypothetical protein HDU93_002483 [Gonapodya sp. JEL0774]|nr:hypothetical protein HDU93_002483 [Gonapodya sp. JEL0774]